jgi:ABC-2 type transport system permease protein
MTRGILLVAGHAFGRVFRGQRIVWLALVAATPALLATLQSRHARGLLEAFVGTTLYFTLQAVIPFLGLMIGVSILGDEIEGRTITYLYTRPHPRPVYFLGRLLGTGAGYTLVVGVAVLAAALRYAGPVGLGAAEIGGTVLAALGGLWAYTCFFAVLRLLFQRALFVGFLLTGVVEGGISKLEHGNVADLSIWHHAALVFTRSVEGKRIPDELLLGLHPEETSGGAWGALAGVVVVSTLLGCFLVHRREVRVPAAVA